MTELLLQDVRVADQAGFTALHFCAYANAVDTCRILLDKGADINAKSTKGYTPVCSAAEHHKVIFARYRRLLPLYIYPVHVCILPGDSLSSWSIYTLM